VKRKGLSTLARARQAGARGPKWRLYGILALAGVAAVLGGGAAGYAGERLGLNAHLTRLLSGFSVAFVFLVIFWRCNLRGPSRPEEGR
jgi:hypothetical protein